MKLEQKRKGSKNFASPNPKESRDSLTSGEQIKSEGPRLPSEGGRKEKNLSLSWEGKGGGGKSSIWEGIIEL